MKITGVELRTIRMPLVSPFETSFGVQDERVAVLVRVVGSMPSIRPGHARSPSTCRAGVSASRWSSRCTAPSTSTGATEVLRRFLIPALLAECAAGREVTARVGRAAAGSRSSATGWPRPRWRWRCSTPSYGVPGSRSPGTSARRGPSVPSGVLGRHPAVDPGAARRRRAIILPTATSRIKLKIRPGWDVGPVEAVRERFGTLVALQVGRERGVHAG